MKANRSMDFLSGIFKSQIFISAVRVKGGTSFAEWHVAWLTERHNYAEFNSWQMAQRNKLNRKACARLCRAFFGAKFEGAIARLKLRHS